MPKVSNKKSDATANRKPALGGKRNKLYARPEKVKEGTILIDLAKKQWRIGPSIGTGGFGEIYSACCVPDDKYDFVVKCEPHGNGPLFVEMHFYMRNARLEDIQRFQKEHSLKSLGMPYMIGNGSADINGQKHRFIVMPRYGHDIANFFVKNGRKLPEGTIYRLALQMIDVYEFIHSCGYVHADLKAANILLGYGKVKSQAYLVDYGLASHYTTKDFKPDPKKMHNGTIEYTSRDAHHGVPTMRGDMEILGYNIIEWMGVQLPWVQKKLLTAAVKVQIEKEHFMEELPGSLKELFPNGVPGPIAEYMMRVGKMKYNDVPDYAKYRAIFVQALKAMKIANSGDLNFNMTNIVRGKKARAGASKEKYIKHIDTSIEDICASDDDDGDVLFDKVSKDKRNATAALKTTKFVQKRASPLKKSPLKPLTATTEKVPNHTVNRVSPRTKPSSISASLLNSAKGTPGRAEKKSSSLRTSSSSPMSANVNFSPSVRIKRMGGRHGNTVINESLTPNPSATKTYEFNFELDVSMDANVVVNVKRKKKGVLSTENSVSSNSGSKSTSTSKQKLSEDPVQSPVTRVKVRKLDRNADTPSPRTPIVTMKRSRNINKASPR